MSGSRAEQRAGVYGILGTPGAANLPGSRTGSATWVDRNGRLWLLGGLGVPATGPWDTLNDLWVFDPASRQWTWMGGGTSGGQAGVYGTLGTASPANMPGARSNAMSQVDGEGNLWLFGGWGRDGGGAWGALNDVWKYDPSANQWTWMGGSRRAGTAAGTGTYGRPGVAAPANIPGTRSSASTWEDENGHIWLFGGVQPGAKGELALSERSVAV